MIDEKQATKISKFLSLVLRHAPETIGIQLDTAGWSRVDDLLRKMNEAGQPIDLETLVFVVNTNKKKRFALNEDNVLIRANQGHSVVVDHGFQSVVPPAILYHGTGRKSLDGIRITGIDKRSRHHVHLSADKATAENVGQRHGKAVVLEILALEMNKNNHEFYLSENDVWLTDYVPIQYIKTLNDEE